MVISKIDQLTDEEFIELIQKSKSYNECLRKLGMSHGRSQNEIIKRRCSRLGITTEHFVQTTKPQTSYSLEEIFVQNSTYKNMTRLKKKILDNHYLEYKCECCGNPGEWMGNPLTLQLDHINGDHTDNRIENLRFLCPNCHTQTETYGSKSRAK